MDTESEKLIIKAIYWIMREQLKASAMEGTKAAMAELEKYLLENREVDPRETD